MTPVKSTRNGRFPSLFDDFFTRDLLDWRNLNFSNTGTTLPAVNIRENDDNYTVEMAAPGMKKEDFKINLDGNLLTISSERSEEREENENERYSMKEFSYQSFQRSFTLPKDVVDIDNINARYSDGVLVLEIPKREEAKKKPPRQIEIK